MRLRQWLLPIMLAMLSITACAPVSTGWRADESGAKQRANGANETQKEAQAVAEAIKAFKEKDPNIKTFFDKAYGYAVFPNVAKGGFVVGAAHGRGRVFQQGRLVGLSRLTQVSVGLQLGGQVYSELIFFKDADTFNAFKDNRIKFDAQASAVAVTYGASANVAYSNGVAVFSLAKGGLMYEASVGGQKFTFTPIIGAGKS